MTLKISSHIPIKLDIGDGQFLELGAKRLNFKEAADLKAKYRSAQNAKGEGEECEALWAELIELCFKRYLRIESEVELELADGVEKIKKAEDLLEVFGGKYGLLVAAVLGVISQSSIDQEKKLLSPLPGDLPPSSDGPEKEVPGQKREPTATSAGNGDSAESEGATPQEATPSGSTDGEKTDLQSSFTNAPSKA